MKKKTTTEKYIEEILRSYFVDRDIKDHWGTLEKRDKIMQFFAEQKHSLIQEIRELVKEAKPKIDREEWPSTFDVVQEAYDEYEANLLKALEEKENDEED